MTTEEKMDKSIEGLQDYDERVEVVKWLLVNVMQEFTSEIDSFQERYLDGKKVGLRLALLLLTDKKKDRGHAAISLNTSRTQYHLTEHELDVIEKWEDR